MKTFGLISTASLFAFISIAAFGQPAATPETFESVSVTLSTTQSPARAGVRIQGERVTGSRLTLEELLVFAHGVQRSQISGPNWISTERFDLTAKTESPVTYPRLRKIFRCCWKIFSNWCRTAKREKCLFIGLSLQRAGQNSVAERSRRLSQRGFADKSPFQPGKAGLYSYKDLPELAEKLGGAPGLDRPVLDRTGIEGQHWFQLEWEAGPDTAGKEALLAALPEQLGLRLGGADGGG